MNVKSEKAVIMMATYNGEKYLRDQLDSLLRQSYKNWELIVSDDSSSDNTLRILIEYQKKEPRIKKILSNKLYHGPFANYFNVMFYVKENLKDEYQYFFYCDQDDVWEANKLSLQISKLKTKNRTPAFCYCDLKICDKKCNDTGDRMSHHIKVPFINNPFNEFFKEQYVWGTAMCHNKALWDLIKVEPTRIVKNKVAHDSYISKYAAIYANIMYIATPLVNYRRIGNNVTETPRNYTLKQALSKLTKEIPKMITNAAMTYWDSLYLLKNILKPNDVSKDLYSCFSGNLIQKLKIIKKYNIMKNEKFFGKCSTFLIFYSGIYKNTSFFKENN